MTATVDVITNKRDKAVAVPISAIVIKTDTSSTKKPEVSQMPDTKTDVIENEEKFECVFVKSGDEAKLRVVETGIQDDTNIEIVSGLNEGDEIITGPYSVVSKTLKSGDKIEVKSDNKKPNGPVEE